MKAAAALLAGLTLALTAQAQAPDDLDRLYADGRYREVAQRMFVPRDNAEARTILGWAQARVQAAAPHAVALAYSDLLWQVGEGRADDRLREEALLVLVYTVMAVAVDGAKCADTGAPDARVRQLLGTRQDRFVFGRALPAPRRAEIRNGALALEISTAARRPEDGDICMSGSEEIARQLATPGTRAQEQPLRPGEVARTVDIRPGPTYRPRFLPPETWHGRQSQVRDLLPGVIERLLPAN